MKIKNTISSLIALVLCSSFAVATVLFSLHAQAQVSSTVPEAAPSTSVNPNNALVLDYSGLVKCDGVVDKNDPNEKNRQKQCDFNALVGEAQAIINWMFVISISVATALFAYAGILYLTGIEKNKGKARSIFTTVGIGFALMAGGWFIITTLMNWVANPTQGFSSLIGGK